VLAERFTGGRFHIGVGNNGHLVTSVRERCAVVVPTE
jgi:hypothetical protein